MIKLVRTETTDEGTFGAMLKADGTTMFYTGELPRYGGDPSQENERRVDCIPAGSYTCKIVQSQKFGKVFEVTGVPGRSAILIHAGNFCGNEQKGYKSHVLGCILLGKTKGVLEGQKAVLQSKQALSEFMALMDDKPFILEISWG